MAKAIGQDGTQRPETGWQNVKLPDQWDPAQILLYGQYMVQNRVGLSVSNHNKTPITIVISYINMAGQVFINDDLLWQDQSLLNHFPVAGRICLVTGVYPYQPKNRVKIFFGYVSRVKESKFRFRSGLLGER